MSNNQQRKPLPLTVFDVMSNWMFAAPVQGSKKRPNLRIKVMGNVPRITVKTGVEGDKNYGKIDFQTDLPTFAAAMSKLKDMAEGKDTSEGYNIDYVDDFLNGKKLDSPIILSTLQLGREKESGKLYMAVLSGDKSRPRIKFYFGPSKYHGIRHRDGSELTEGDVSNAYAIGFLKPACHLVYNYLINNFDEDAKNVAKPMAPGGGNGNNNGGGYNRGGNNGGGGGYNNQNRGGGNGGGYNGGGSGGGSDDFDDDIPEF